MEHIQEDYRIDNVHDHFFVKVFATACVTIDARWDTRDVCSGYWRLYWNDADGAALALADGSRYPLSGGRVHLVPAWVRFSCMNRRPLTHRFVHFDLIGVVAATVQRLFTKPLCLRAHSPATVLARQVGEGATPDVAVCQAKSAVYAALASVLASRSVGDASLLVAPGPVAPAVQYIEDHLGERIVNRALAVHCRMSEDHFGRVFRERVGRTPTQYVIERRLAAASQALAFTDTGVDEIAERFGFSSRFHLTRLFSQRMGVAPAAYRRRARV